MTLHNKEVRKLWAKFSVYFLMVQAMMNSSSGDNHKIMIEMELCTRNTIQSLCTDIASNSSF